MTYQNNLDKILRTFQVEVVSDDPDKLHAALSLAAELYARLSSHNLHEDAVYQELFQDSYQKYGYARTVLLTGYNPSTDSIEVLGTGRAICGPSESQEPVLTQLEAMQLVTPDCGWCKFAFDGFDLTNAFEIGRFAIAQNCRIGVARQLDFHLHVTNYLIRTCRDIANKAFLKEQAWAVMTDYVAQTLENAGIGVTEIASVSLNRDGNVALFSKYDKYWIHNSPNFYKLDIPPESALTKPATD